MVRVLFRKEDQSLHYKVVMSSSDDLDFDVSEDSDRIYSDIDTSVFVLIPSDFTIQMNHESHSYRNSKYLPEHLARKACWGNYIVSIDTVVRSNLSGRLLVLVTWIDGRYFHDATILHIKATQKLIHFYESRLTI